MDASRQRSKRHRALPADRRNALIAATLRSLAEGGREGASVRRIAARAGVSTGLINHHYGSVTALIADAYRSLAGQLLADLRASVAAAASDPTARLEAFIATAFKAGPTRPEMLNAWLVFWEMIRHAPEVQAAHDETFGAYRAFLETVLEAFKAGHQKAIFDARLAAIGLSALLDGLWLERCFNHRTFSRTEAMRLCLDFVNGVARAGASPKPARARSARPSILDSRSLPK